MTPEQWHQMATHLAGFPSAVGVLLIEHERGRNGHCRTCTRNGLTYLRHPCLLRELAEQAADILAASRGNAEWRAA